jgi:hypothetical protein
VSVSRTALWAGGGLSGLSAARLCPSFLRSPVEALPHCPPPPHAEVEAQNKELSSRASNAAADASEVQQLVEEHRTLQAALKELQVGHRTNGSDPDPDLD